MVSRDYDDWSEDKPHRYHFRYSPRHEMNLPSGYNRQALLDAMKGHVVGKGELIGMYRRKPDVRDDK